jgi:hypothetical protein
MMPFDDIHIVPAALGPDSVLIGAVRALLDFGGS